MRPILAGYDARCELCALPIAEGDEIVKLEDDGVWVHAQCAEDEGEQVDR